MKTFSRSAVAAAALTTEHPGSEKQKGSTPAQPAEESYKSWLNGFTTDGKIPLKDLQDIYDQAYASKLIPTPVAAAQVMDYSLTDEVFREKK